MKNTKMKINRNPRRSLTKMDAKAGISPTSMKRLVRDGLKMTFFRLLKRHHLTEQQTPKRLERSQVLLEMMQNGTQTGEVVFSDEKISTIEVSRNKKNDLVIGTTSASIPDEHRHVTRQQKLASVLVWTAVSRTWRSPQNPRARGARGHREL